MRLAFVVADVRAQQPSWATVYLARAAERAGHDVAFVGADDLTLTLDNQVSAMTLRPGRPTTTNEDLCRGLADAKAVARHEKLSSYDVVFLRYHPQREGLGAGHPAADFGWRLGLGGVLVVNDPLGTQRAGGRMYLSGLPAEIRPRTLITHDPARIKAFLKTLDAPAVVKPLDERHGGPDTVFYLRRGQVKNLNQIIDAVRKTGYAVVQEFLPEAKEGEKRLLLLGGEPIREGRRVAIYRRTRGHEDAPPARRRCDYGPIEQRIVDLLRPKLISDGLYFVGIDLVGAKVLEVNVFTPGGLKANLELYGIDVAAAVVRDLERRVQVRQAYKKVEGI